MTDIDDTVVPDAARTAGTVGEVDTDWVVNANDDDFYDLHSGVIADAVNARIREVTEQARQQGRAEILDVAIRLVENLSGDAAYETLRRMADEAVR